MEVQQGPAVNHPKKQPTLGSLAKLNRHDIVGRALEQLIANGELADYDDELANRVKDAIKIVRGVTELEVENRRMREALDLFWSQSLAIETLARRAYGESSQIYQNVLAAILKAEEFYKNLPKATRAALSQEEKHVRDAE